MSSRSGEELTELEARQEPRLVKSLEMVAPGTALREGIDSILDAQTGGLIVMQLEETMVGVAADKAALVHDYLAEHTDEAFAAALDQIGRLPHQDLLDFGRLAELMGYDRKLNTLDYPVKPRGYRILGRIPRLPEPVVHNVVSEFEGLDEILAAPDSQLESVEGVGDMRAKDIREGLRRLQEINLVDRYLQT